MFSDTFIKDTARKFGPGGQTLTPRHTIDAILGLSARNGENGGSFEYYINFYYFIVIQFF